MDSYYVIEEWTKDNMGEFNASSVYMNVPRSQFAKRIGQTAKSESPISISAELSEKIETASRERLIVSGRIKAKPSVRVKDNLFIDSELGNPAVKVENVVSLSLSETLGEKVRTFKHQYVSFFDTKIKSTNGKQSEESNAEREPITILSDLEFSFVAEGQKEFATYCNRKSPVGYSALRPLYAGDYEYKDAIVGVQVTLSPPVDGRYGIVGSKLNVDVEDVVDKGEDEVVGLTMIGFNKSYYTKPKIFTHISNANQPCVAVIEEISIDALPNYPRGYFKVRFKSLEDGTDVNGWLSWLAEGY